MSLKISIPNKLCYCTDDQHYNCSINELKPVYPGQTFSLNVFVNDDSNKEVLILIYSHLYRACKTHSINNYVVLNSKTCSKIQYRSILYMVGDGCNVYLNGRISASPFGYKSPLYRMDVYHVSISSCPLGFALIEILRICQCDPILRRVTPSPDSCNIDTQTIPRPANYRCRQQAYLSSVLTLPI